MAVQKIIKYITAMQTQLEKWSNDQNHLTSSLVDYFMNIYNYS